MDNVRDNVFRCIILCIVWQSTAEDEWNSKDYLKREFSLVKPYSGFVNAAFRMFSVYLKSRPRPLVQSQTDATKNITTPLCRW